ncbi:hypothetical protein T07_3458 [Trichinella nelsoni]|uniref:Uncharacterized protein n=1 Tax=Trichinella nelsoni TaxID=6336 RepID=A0A0V0SH44_9BILA|nr:hypothetical protein T07_3458 [Trichinella nelsoni]
MAPYQYELANLEMMKRRGREVSDRLKFLLRKQNKKRHQYVNSFHCQLRYLEERSYRSVLDLRSGD